MRKLLPALALLLTQNALAGDMNYQRAHYNYQMFCQGCHTPDGSGAMSVPQMKGHVGHVLEIPRGREYLVRVPGSATSALDDEQLAEVLNWIMLEFAGESLAPDYQRYTSTEVGQLRQTPLNEVAQYREQLLVDIARAKSGE